MKRILYISIALFFVLSCAENNELFEESSTARVNQQIADYTELLVNAECGWKMELYPSPSRLGGYNFWFDFDENGRVLMACDLQNDTQESSYSLNSGEGIVLNFDTYSLLHILADPKYSPAGTGYGADFELVVKRATVDSLICYGRKNGRPMILTRANESDWTSRSQLMQNEVTLSPYQENAPFFRNVRINGEGICTFLYSANTRFIQYFYVDAVSGETKSGQSPVLFTKEGFTLHRGLYINGVYLKDFTYEAESNQFVFEESGTLTMEHESAVEFDNAWDDFYKTSGGSLYSTSADFLTLFNEAKTYEPGLITLQFYWNISGYRLFSFVFYEGDGAGGYSTTPYWIYSYIGSIKSPGEDCVIFIPMLDADGNKVFMGGSDTDPNQINRTFFGNTARSRKFNELLDLIYDDKGFTIIPISDKQYYLISKSKSNYWLIMNTFN